MKSRDTTHSGLKEGLVRRTFIVDEDLADKINSISYWRRIPIKNVMNEALLFYIINNKDAVHMETKSAHDICMED